MGLGMLLRLIAAVAPIVAIYAKTGELEDTSLITLPIVLTGLAIGAARRARAGQVLAQIGLTACAILVWIGLLLDAYATFLFYSFPMALFAVTIVAPLMVRNALDTIADRWRGRIKAAADISWNVGLNVGAVLAFLWLLEIMPVNTRTVRSINVPINAAAPAPVYGVAPEDDLDDQAEPASLKPSKGPYQRGCEGSVFPWPVLEAGTR